MNKKDFDKTLEAHLKAVPCECRWCFAIDGRRVAGEEVNFFSFPDLIVVHLRCPRCGGEFTYVSEGFEMGYLVERICTLYPQLSSFIREGVKLKFQPQLRGKVKRPSTQDEYILEVAECTEGTLEARIMDCLFPELREGSPERCRVLDLLVPKLSRPSRGKRRTRP